MRKLWVKAWITLDGVFDADTMDHGGILLVVTLVESCRRQQVV